MLSDFTWNMTGYIPKHQVNPHGDGIIPYVAERIFQLEPEPPKVGSLNEYILSALQEKNLIHFSFFLHHYEPQLNKRIKDFLGVDGGDLYDTDRFIDIKLSCREQMLQKLMDYDLTKGAEYATYIYPFIRDAMLRFRMLDAAMTGSFSENNFDESQLSALETKFAHYLSAAEASSQNIAQEKDKIKTLIADISHQTKTPIANLLLYSELLKEETLPASAKANVEALYKQSEKLRFLIDSLVKLSRLENGIISLSPQQAALQPLLESVVEQYTAKASEKGLSLRLQDTDAFAVFDFKWTAEALANIVDNAIKYTEHGTITISAVSYEMFSRIDISDTGSGIPESEQAKIFARFYRSNSVQKQEGVGIGLYLARQIISGEGGYIKVASVPGKGSTFSIFLPK